MQNRSFSGSRTGQPGGDRARSQAGLPAGNGGTEADREMEKLLQPPSEPYQYFSDNDRRAPRREIFAEDAKKVGRELATLPASQLRRFYAEALALKRQIELDPNFPDPAVIARMHLLKARAGYTWARRPKDYPEELVAFFTRHAAAVQGRDDFRLGFQPHFEAVMAFHKMFEQKQKDRD
jgi:CRISPR type III-A-associated protein Csm2